MIEHADPTILRRWIDEVWNRGRDDVIDELFAEHWVGHDLQQPGCTGQTTGREQFKSAHRAFRSAFSNVEVKVDETMVAGDRIAVRCVAHGVHTGNGIGVSPTGKPVHITGTILARVQDGRVVESWDNWDVMGLYLQLGVNVG
jgi:predicted ester cyclase